MPLCAPKSDRPRSSARAEIDSGKHHVSPPPRVRVRTPIPPFPTAPKPLRASGRLRVGAVNHHGSRHRHALFCKRPLSAAGTPTADSRREARSDVAGADSPAGHERQPDALHCGSNAEHTRTGQNKAGQSKAGQSRGRLSLSDTPPSVAPRLDSTTRVPTPSGQPPSCLRPCPLWLPTLPTPLLPQQLSAALGGSAVDRQRQRQHAAAPPRRHRHVEFTAVTRN